MRVVIGNTENAHLLATKLKAPFSLIEQQTFPDGETSLALPAKLPIADILIDWRFNLEESSARNMTIYSANTIDNITSQIDITTALTAALQQIPFS